MAVIDWEGPIEADWRAGLKTPTQMSQQYGVSRAAMQKHFDKFKIPRDLSKKIAAETKALVTQQAVTNRMRVTEADIVHDNAALQAGIIYGQRLDIQRYVKLAQAMLSELETTTENRELYDQLGELMYAPDERGIDKLKVIYDKVMSIPGRVDALKKLSEVLKTLIGLERQAFGLSDNSNGEADKPPAQDTAELTNDAARRIAFVLLNAERKLLT